MYKLTKNTPKEEGYYWLNILKKDGTPKKGYPRVVQVKLDDRLSVAGRKVKTNTLIAWGLWTSANPKRLYENYRWSKKIEEPN